MPRKLITDYLNKGIMPPKILVGFEYGGKLVKLLAHISPYSSGNAKLHGL
ncbi:hypothetical protein JCM19240_4350 [Vibrio maritimus]|uniref:Uncharacterized protein n=1 Tax=Vibrio maritimus TaxID=990268 RepID=A0A090T491_9VIBR|nr:hypothetical protein JCM19240_4350 [Vibrio maritimus]